MFEVGSSPLREVNSRLGEGRPDIAAKLSRMRLRLVQERLFARIAITMSSA